MSDIIKSPKKPEIQSVRFYENQLIEARRLNVNVSEVCRRALDKELKRVRKALNKF
jgi:post-segregation antitoxin (ccd killing protein)